MKGGIVATVEGVEITPTPVYGTKTVVYVTGAEGPGLATMYVPGNVLDGGMADKVTGSEIGLVPVYSVNWVT